MKKIPDVSYTVEEVSSPDVGRIYDILSWFSIKGKKSSHKAVISANGSLTIKIIRCMSSMNLIPGRDMGFLGIDDIEWSDIILNGLTTIRQPTDEIGYAAMDLLSSRIENPCIPIREKVFRGDLIIRETTKRLLRQNK
ncbi:substrate-binding domain-containing protein [Escherichia coli]|nr:substrate-binding domain-containing protein [Escherichia coli]